VRRFRAGASADTRIERAAAALRVAKARQGATDFPGSIYVMPELPVERIAGWHADTGDALAEWLGEFLTASRQDDVRRKLADSGAAERHTFVIFPGFADAPFSVIGLLLDDEAPLPQTDPILPNEVTDVWAAKTAPERGLYRGARI
jgi:hypothetical protein